VVGGVADNMSDRKFSILLYFWVRPALFMLDRKSPFVRANPSKDGDAKLRSYLL
jgi:hypothetical protein